MTLPNTRRADRAAPAPAYAPGCFSESVRAWKSMQFESRIRIDPRTKRMREETDYERQQRIRESSGWTAINWAKFGSIK